MTGRIITFVALIALAATGPVAARTSDNVGNGSSAASGRELAPYLQCVPYARQQSGIQIYGDAHTWWKKAEGRFKRGNRPKVGAVMAFQPHRNMRLGHVAAVSKIVDSRTVLLRHSNWSPINGRRGQIENDVRAVDVSQGNDWSRVRVWYHPSQALGKTAWPIHGFIYSDKAPKFETPNFRAPTRLAKAPAPHKPVSKKPSRKFANAFASLDLKSQPATRAVAKYSTPQKRAVTRKVVQRVQPRRANQRDPIASAISKYD